MDIYESRDLCASYGLDSAMAFDGGSSTSLNYKDINVVSTQEKGDTGRDIKIIYDYKKEIKSVFDKLESNEEERSAV